MIMVRDIQRATAEHYGLPVEAMRQSGMGAKLREVSHPRQMAMLLSRRMTRKSYSLIAHVFDRDHSTVITGIRAARRRCLADRENLKDLCAIRAHLLQNSVDVECGETPRFSANDQPGCAHPIHSFARFVLPSLDDGSEA